jgi:hypothetical protein
MGLVQIWERGGGGDKKSKKKQERKVRKELNSWSYLVFGEEDVGIVHGPVWPRDEHIEIIQ